MAGERFSSFGSLFFLLEQESISYGGSLVSTSSQFRSLEDFVGARFRRLCSFLLLLSLLLLLPATSNVVEELSTKLFCQALICLAIRFGSRSRWFGNVINVNWN